MAPIVTTARIVCKSKEARVTILEAFHKIIEFTQPHEPEVIRYVVTLPVDDTTGTVLYMIEEYAHQAASDAHLATAPVQDLIALFTTGDVLAAAPEVHNSHVLASKPCIPPPALSTNPAILLSHTVYKPNSLANSVKDWSDIVEYVAKNEYWTRGYTVAEEKETNSVRTVETYESWGALDNVHAKSEVVAKGLALSAKEGTGVRGAVRVRAVDGFLGRDGGSKL